MPSDNYPSISSYQSAILTEMGISNWALSSLSNIDNENGVNVLEAQVQRTQEVPASSVSKEDALAKLKKLKSNVEPLKETHAILTSFSQKDILSPIFKDILLLLELTAEDVLHIESGQQSAYKGYPIAWEEGEQISFESKQLFTPHFDTLTTNPDLKKRLWRQLQVSSS